MSNDIKAIRASTGLSQQGFADRFTIPKRTIEEWEAGRRTPPAYVVKMLRKIIKYERELKMDKNMIGFVNAPVIDADLNITVGWSSGLLAEESELRSVYKTFVSFADAHLRSYEDNLAEIVNDIQEEVAIYSAHRLSCEDVAEIEEKCSWWLAGHSKTKQDGTVNCFAAGRMTAGELRGYLGISKYHPDTSRKALIRELAKAGFEGTDDDTIEDIFAIARTDEDRIAIAKELVDYDTYGDVLECIDYAWPDDVDNMGDWQLHVCVHELALNMVGKWLDDEGIAALKPAWA